MLNHESSIIRPRWLGSAACLTLLAAFTTQGCGSDDKGTDILVPAGGSNAGSAGKSSSGGSNGKAGNSAGGSENQDGGAGGIEATGGESGTGASTNGGTAGTGGSGGGKAGSGGAAGTGGGAGSGGAAGTGGGAGTGGASGSAGTAGAGGMAGNAGAGGKGGSGGTAGSAGTGGIAGSGGTAGGGGVAGSGGSAGSGTVCGNGLVDGTEQCDNGMDGTPWKGDRVCSNACKNVVSQACVDCEQAGDCSSSSDNCMGPSATPFSLENVGLCYQVFECLHDSHCMDGTGSFGKCYCGDLSTAACGAAPFDLSKAGAPNGPCAEIMQLGAPGVTSNSVIIGPFAKSRPLGAAGQRINCEKTATECADACGIVLNP